MSADASDILSEIDTALSTQPDLFATVLDTTFTGGWNAEALADDFVAHTEARRRASREAGVFWWNMAEHVHHDPEQCYAQVHYAYQAGEVIPEHELRTRPWQTQLCTEERSNIALSAEGYTGVTREQTQLYFTGLGASPKERAGRRGRRYGLGRELGDQIDWQL